MDDLEHADAVKCSSLLFDMTLKDQAILLEYNTLESPSEDSNLFAKKSYLQLCFGIWK